MLDTAETLCERCRGPDAAEVQASEQLRAHSAPAAAARTQLPRHREARRGARSSLSGNSPAMKSDRTARATALLDAVRVRIGARGTSRSDRGHPRHVREDTDEITHLKLQHRALERGLQCRAFAEQKPEQTEQKLGLTSAQSLASTTEHGFHTIEIRNCLINTKPDFV